jgi:uncharacterized protein YbaR (Trm112 family)
MSTIDFLYHAKIQQFSDRKKEAEKIEDPEEQKRAIKSIDCEETEYMLSVGPILKEYLVAKDEHNDPLGRSQSTDGVLGFVTVESSTQKGQMYKRYMAEIEKKEEYATKLLHEQLAKRTREDVCDECKDVDLVTDSRTGELVCPSCGLCYRVFSYTDVDHLTFDQIKSYDMTRGNYSYKRSNHWSEWISKLQAREMTSIPDSVIDALRLELKKARLTDASLITAKKIRELLKKLKLSKYYEHVQNITCILTGKAPPKFSLELEAKLRQMFEVIQEPFELYKPASRTNFLSYSYVLFKSLQLLEEDQYLEYLSLLKSNRKLYESDRLWKQICAHLKWQFIPSI